MHKFIIKLIFIFVLSQAAHAEEECSAERRILLSKGALGEVVMKKTPNIFQHKWMESIDRWYIVYCGKVNEWCSWVMITKECEVDMIQPPLPEHANH